MAYIVSSIPPFYSNNTSAPSPFYPSYNSPLYPSYTTNIPPSPNHFYPSEVTSPNLSASYYNYGSEGYSNYYDNSNYPIFDGKDDAYGWILCTERYFKSKRTSEMDKMVVAAMAMRGEALKWWLCWSKCHPQLGWDEFTTHFLWQFKPEYREVLSVAYENELEENEKQQHEEEAKSQLIEAQSIFVQEDLTVEEPKEPLHIVEAEDLIGVKNLEPPFCVTASTAFTVSYPVQNTRFESEKVVPEPKEHRDTRTTSFNFYETSFHGFYGDPEVCDKRSKPLPPPKPPDYKLKFEHSLVLLSPLDQQLVFDKSHLFISSIFHENELLATKFGHLSYVYSWIPPQNKLQLIISASTVPYACSNAPAVAFSHPPLLDLKWFASKQSAPFIQNIICMNPFLSFSAGHVSAFERYISVKIYLTLSHMCDNGYHRYNNHPHTPYFFKQPSNASVIISHAHHNARHWPWDECYFLMLNWEWKSGILVKKIWCLKWQSVLNGNNGISEDI